MADKNETESPAVEKPAEEEAAAEKEEEKSKASKEKKPRKPKTAAHPPYFEMIKEALLTLNEKSESSPYAIAKYIEEKHKSVLPANFRKTLALQLKNLAAKGKLIKIRASYKLSSDTTKKQRPATATTMGTRTRTRTRTRSSSTRAKTISVNKPEVATKKKRSGTRKAKPRQPKSIKAPAAKKAMKASATF